MTCLPSSYYPSESAAKCWEDANRTVRESQIHIFQDSAENEEVNHAGIKIMLGSDCSRARINMARLHDPAGV